MVAISMEDPETLRAFAKRKGATFPLLTDPRGEITQLFQAESIPANFFLDKQGRLVDASVGYDPVNGPDYLDGLAKQLVNEEKKKS